MNIPGDAKVDLHLHTTASDGTWRPEKLVKNIQTSGIRVFAVTDHDSTKNIAATAALAQENHLKFIAGVEVNTTYNHRNYHILGLGIAFENRELQALLKRNRELMAEQDDASIQYLEKEYPAVSFDEYQRYRNNPEKGGWKALNYLIDKQLCRNHQDFFALLKPWGNFFEKVLFASPREAIETIRQAGGTPILAHPGAPFYDRNYQALIAFMIEAGIMGIECYHPENSPEIIRYCLDICDAEKLLITGGSDCHGGYVPSRCLGRPEIRMSQLRLEGIRVIG